MIVPANVSKQRRRIIEAYIELRNTSGEDLEKMNMKTVTPLVAIRTKHSRNSGFVRGVISDYIAFLREYAQ